MKGGLCFLHANPESAKTLGQLGGQKNRRLPVVGLEIPEKMTLSDLSTLNARAMHLLVSGELQPRAATALAQLSNAQVRVMQGVELEARLIALEAQVAREQSNAWGDSQLAEGTEVATDDHGEAAEIIGGNDSELAKGAFSEDEAEPASEPEHLNTAQANGGAEAITTKKNDRNKRNGKGTQSSELGKAAERQPV